ncbi:MAG: caspase family protein [Eubacterium sp.]|nr:caspase family protein [Eubacterium sp.]
MKNQSIYAVLAGVCEYVKMQLPDLPACKNDVMLMRAALTERLKVPADQIRVLDGTDHSGSVRTTDLAHAIAAFRNLQDAEAMFIFYYSGHGRAGSLVFSDEQIDLQSVIRYLSQLPVKSGLVILDCCYSGDFEGPGARRMQFEESIAAFAGSGTAVFASSSADEASRLGPDGSHSVFTGALATAILQVCRPSEGKISLDEIRDRTMELVQRWNLTHPGKEQQPVFRSGIGGTIYFQAEEWVPYQQENVQFAGKGYRLVRVKPLSTGTVKRLAAFIVTEADTSAENLPAITKEVAERIKYAEVHANKTSEKRFRGKPARVIWCYFGQSDSDLINSTHYAYTIWAADEEMKNLFFRENRHAEVLDGIYVFTNPSYKLLKEIQKPSESREELIQNHQRLLAEIVTLAEQFIYDLQEAVNQKDPSGWKPAEINENTEQAGVFIAMKQRYGSWIERVRRLFISLSDEDVPPDDLHDWADEIMDLAGWVMNLAVILERNPSAKGFSQDDLWLIRHAIGRYYRSVEKLKILEHAIYRR